MKTIRVLVADESVFIRQQVTKMLSGRDDITVIGGASNGGEAVVKVLDLLPSVVLMGCQMPLMDGFVAMQKIIERTGIPVVMLIINRKNPEKDSQEALSLGATDCIVLKSALISKDIISIKKELIEKIISASELNKPQSKITTKNTAEFTNTENPAQINKIQHITENNTQLTHNKKNIPDTIEIVVIGVSTGGPMALHQLVPKLPFNFPVPIIIVQHLPAHFTASLALRLDGISVIKVKEAVDGMKLSSGTVFIARGGKQMQITSDKTIRLSEDDCNVIYKPSIDVLVNSVVDVFGGNAIGVMMTGMGSDGANSFKNLHRHGGYIIVQDEKSSIVYGMPKAVVEANIVDEISPLENLAESICSCFGIHSMNQNEININKLSEK